ncbi:MAG TPA: flagellar hook capping FlgD N-terminal domain-containing protein [Tissierellaceae bacterium]|nr:flagellar hook capping FlgD N-terminal domain-containing protein [Tissierellaceae bacterium]
MRINPNYYNQLERTSEKGHNQLDINDFLQIMVAEIQSMNPLSSEGGSKTDYIAQMVQFTTLEQMSDMAEGIGLLNLMGQQQYSFSLIGKEVTLEQGDQLITGVVDKVKFQYGSILLEIDGKDYYLGDVVEVANKEVEK